MGKKIKNPTLEDLITEKNKPGFRPFYMTIYFFVIILIMSGLRLWLYFTTDGDNIPQMLIDIFGWGFNIFTLLILVIQIIHQRHSNAIMNKQLADFKGQNNIIASQLELQQIQFNNQMSSNLKVIARKQLYSNSIEDIHFELYNVGNASAYDINIDLITDGDSVRREPLNNLNVFFIPLLKSQDITKRVVSKPVRDKLIRISIFYKDPFDDNKELIVSLDSII